MYIRRKWGPGPEVSQGGSALDCRTFRRRPHPVASTGWRGNAAFVPLLNRFYQGNSGFPECITASRGLPVSCSLRQLDASPGLCRSGTVTFLCPLAAIATPYLSCLSSGEVSAAWLMRMSVSASRMSIVRIFPAQAPAGVGPHAFRPEPRQDPVHLFRPAFRLCLTVFVVSENLREAIFRQGGNRLPGGHGGYLPGVPASGQPVSIIVKGQASHFQGKHPIICGRADPRWHSTVTQVHVAYWYLPTGRASPRLLPPAERIVDAKTDRIPLAA